MFVARDSESAPKASKPYVDGATKKLGYLPSPIALMADSPTVLESFTKGVDCFARSSLSEVERETVVLTMARVLGCHYCVAMHVGILAKLGVPALAERLTRGEAPTEPRLAALVRFVERLLETHGGVDDDDLRAFGSAGFDARAALDVVAGIGAYTVSIFANRMTRAPLDPELTGVEDSGAQS
jgi:AhpD family alkylhydroperoxidase